VYMYGIISSISALTRDTVFTNNTAGGISTIYMYTDLSDVSSTVLTTVCR
jgi:hypothetical protein